MKPATGASSGVTATVSGASPTLMAAPAVLVSTAIGGRYRSSVHAMSPDLNANGQSPVRPRKSVAVVGAGFGGVGAAVMLRRAGYRDVTVFERGERVGGVWNHNTYPGAACDVPSHLYEFSFAPNPRWSRRYAPQAEIQAYVEDVARRHGVLDGRSHGHRGDGRDVG